MPLFLFSDNLLQHDIICALCGGQIELPAKYSEYFDLIKSNPEIFPGFFHVRLAENVLPRLALLRQFGFYPDPKKRSTPDAESCGAHSPRIRPQELATRATSD